MTYLRVVGCLPLLLAVGCLEPTNPCDPDAPLTAKSVTMTGSVRDVYGVVQPGVVISVAGRPETTISGADGRYTLANLPATATGYQVITTPAAPAVGGVRSVPASLLSSCGPSQKEVELVIANVAAAPEPELVRAVDANTLMVAFSVERIKFAQKPPSTIIDAGAVVEPGPIGGIQVGEDDVAEDTGVWDGEQDEPVADGNGVPASAAGEGSGGASQRVFGSDAARTSAASYTSSCATISDAALRSYVVELRSPFGEWRKAVLSIDPWRRSADPSMATVDDMCAAAACSQWTHLAPELASNNARCVLVVGLANEDGSTTPLDTYGNYEVRVQSEARLLPTLTVEQSLPGVVRSTISTRRLATSLVPNALIDVVREDASSMSDEMRTKEINTVVPLSSGRFAVYAQDTMRIVGDALVSMNEDANLNDNSAAAGAMGSDGAAAEVVSEQTWGVELDLRPVASTLSSDGTAVYSLLRSAPINGSAPKLVLREARLDDLNIQGQQPMIDFTTHFKLDALNAPNSRLLDVVALPKLADDITTSLVNEADIQTFVAVFQNFLLRFAQLRRPNEFASANVSALLKDAAGITDVEFVGEAESPCSTLIVSTDASFVYGGTEVASALACIPLRDTSGLGRTAVKAGPVGPDGNFQVMIAQDGNSVMTVNLRSGVVVRDRPVGAVPADAKLSTILSCDGAADEEVLVVANRGSRDLSILTRSDDRIERSIVALPVAPVEILRGTPTCDNPFLWVIGEDGALVPVNMTSIGDGVVRGAPLCGDVGCQVPSRGRARVGAVNAGKVIVGGAGLVGEVGFFRPKAPFGTVDQLDGQ